MMATQKRCNALRAIMAASVVVLAPTIARAGSVTATANVTVTVLDPMRLTPVSNLAVASAIRPVSGSIGATITPASFDLIAPPHAPFHADGSLHLAVVEPQAERYLSTGIAGVSGAWCGRARGTRGQGDRETGGRWSI